ncbi:MAG: ATP-binding protein [Myxococcota bacterium]
MLDHDALANLIARVDSLRTMVAEVANAIADSLDVTADGREGHDKRLQAHHTRIAPLRGGNAPLSQLSQRYNLDILDEDIVLLSLAASLDRRFGQLLASLQRTFTSTHPTVDLLLNLLTLNFRDRLATLRRFEPNAPLLTQGLIHLSSPAMNPSLLASEVRVSERIQRRLLYGDARLSVLGDYATLTQSQRSFDTIWLPDADRARLLAVLDTHAKVVERCGPGAALVLLTGPSGVGKSAVAAACAHHLGAALMTLDASALSSQLARNRDTLQQLAHEASSARALMFFDHCELLFGTRLQGNRDLAFMLDILDRAPGPILLATSIETMLDPMVHRRILLRIALDTPSVAHRESLWRRAFDTDIPLADTVELPYVAEQYDFNGGQIVLAARLAAARALARDAAQPTITPEDIEDASEARRQHHLAQLAVRSSSQLRLDDLVLPDTLMNTIQSILAAVRNRRRIFEEWGFGERLITGRGLSMLFRGVSGTGKTLSAEIIAAELSLPLYRVSIPRIVSKYIGETEQNLEKAFREAEVAGAILLFDEADSIFTKRVEVSSSTDRYSNMEVNLLLQEMERFEGVVILTTNLDAAIDDAFERRLNYKLDFPFPDAGLRRQIWERLIPSNAPRDLDDDDLPYLAEQFELTGGSIKNVVLRAAYAAAERGDPINIEHLEAAAFQEYKELGKLIRSH